MNNTEENKKEEVKKETAPASGNIFKKGWLQSIIAIIVIFGALGGFLFWQSKKDTVSIEDSDLQAPIINLSPTAPGTLNALYVKEGDVVAANAQIALVGSQIISAQDGGIVSYAPNVLGSYIAPGQTVASIVDVDQMKVVGQIDETKGLKNIMVGQRATFSVDAFPGKTYEGIVNEISPTSDDTDIVFSISDKRPTKSFDVKVNFDISQYPELKSGMSAKITVHTK